MAQASDMRTGAVQARRASFEGLPTELRCTIYTLLMPPSMDVLAMLKADKMQHRPAQSLATYSLRRDDDLSNWRHTKKLRKVRRTIHDEIEDTWKSMAKEVEVKIDLAAHCHSEWSEGYLLEMRYPFVAFPSLFSMQHVRHLTLSEVYRYAVVIAAGLHDIVDFTAERFTISFARNQEGKWAVQDPVWAADSENESPLAAYYDTQEVREMMDVLRQKPLELMSAGCKYDLGGEMLTARGIYELQERLLSVEGEMYGLVPPRAKVKMQPIEHDRNDYLLP